VGILGLRLMWNLSREQRDDSVRQQAELAAAAFDRWLEAQRQPLETLAKLSDVQDVRSTSFGASLRATVSSRPNWIDLRIVDSNGRTLVSQPVGEPELPPALIRFLLDEIHRRESWAVVTDRTRDELRPIFAIAAPMSAGGAVIAQVDGVAMHELFRDIELSTRSVIAVFDDQRRILYRRQTRETPVDANVSVDPLFASLGESRTSVVEVESPYDGVRRVYGLARPGTTDFIVMVGIPSAALYEPARQQLIRYMIFSLLALACATGLALIIERSIATPVRRLRRAAQKLGAGDLKARSTVVGRGEIGELGVAFNLMAEQIKEREERLAELDRLKSAFVSSVSHELRTPLTTIKTLTRVLQRGGQRESERREYLDAIAAECDRQIDLVLNLLDLTRIEASAYKVSLTTVNPAELVMNCVAFAQRAAALRGQFLAADLPSELPPMLTDSGALRRVLCSLIENATKYTPEGGSILVSAHPTERDEIALSVTDNGSGIAAEDLPHIFDKFFRGRPAAGEPAGGDSKASEPELNAAHGIGLGLFLARTIVDQLGGRITVESKPEGGARFSVYVPRAKVRTREGEEPGLENDGRIDFEAIAGSRR
jgi:signal transduction histidine kinase